MPEDILQIGGLEGPEVDDSEAVTRLRERAATALERGLGFIVEYGDDLALLRAHVALDAASPADVIEQVAGRQREDGAFEPFGFVFSGAIAAELRAAALDPTLVGTLEAIAVLADVRGLVSSTAERAVEHLTRVQRHDGSWGSVDPTAPEKSPEADRLFATGMLAGYAMRTPFVRPEVVEWAGRFLTNLWSPERVEGGHLPAIAAFAHFFANGGAPDISDEALQWCGRELERGFRDHRFEAVQTLRVLFYCDAEALPGATFDVVELLDRLLGEQAADGGFAALDPGGPPGRGAPTIDALIAIRSLCQAL
ncbi:MAG: hypothetical protein VX466_09930 [Myxococcota bacterium]|nr:hypothetical protein [Myxococcota bacterium]